MFMVANNYRTPEHLHRPDILCAGTFTQNRYSLCRNIYMYVLLIVVCPFVLVLLVIVLSLLLRYTDSDCSFGILKLFLHKPNIPCAGTFSQGRYSLCQNIYIDQIFRVLKHLHTPYIPYAGTFTQVRYSLLRNIYIDLIFPIHHIFPMPEHLHRPDIFFVLH